MLNTVQGFAATIAIRMK